jgi:hypothetical protein
MKTFRIDEFKPSRFWLESAPIVQAIVPRSAIEKLRTTLSQKFTVISPIALGGKTRDTQAFLSPWPLRLQSKQFAGEFRTSRANLERPIECLNANWRLTFFISLASQIGQMS